MRFFLPLAATAVIALISLSSALHHHDDHSRIFLHRGILNTIEHPAFHLEQHPSRYYAHQTLNERLADNTEHSFLVHFASKDHLHAYAEKLQALEGVHIESYIPEGSFHVHTTHSKAKELHGMDFIDWVGYFRPEHKLSSTLETSKEYRLIVQLVKPVENLLQLALQYLENDQFRGQIRLVDTDGDKRIRFDILASDEDLLKQFAEHLAQMPEVAIVERALKHQITNHYAKAIVQFGSEAGTNYRTVDTDLPFWNVGLNGSGQIVGVGDTGLDYRSCFFADAESTNPPQPPFKQWTSMPTAAQMSTPQDLLRRKVVQYVAFGNTMDNGGHGTHVCGSIAGYPVNDLSVPEYRTYSGAAREAKLAFFDVEASESQGLRLPGNLATQYFNWAYAAGARIHSNSWGSANPGYTSDARDVDVFMQARRDFVVLVAAGNDGECGAEDATVGAPATSKNCIAVGASLNAAPFWRTVETEETQMWRGRANFSEISMASFSSQGPTADGRIKPDVAAPGYFITSASNNQVRGSQCNAMNLRGATQQQAGTSMATPILAGHVALVRQYFMRGFYPSGVPTATNVFVPSGSLLKAITINGAVQMLGEKISLSPTQRGTACGIRGPRRLGMRPDFSQGFGRFQMNQVLFAKQLGSNSFLYIPSFDASATNNFNDRSIKGGETHSYAFCAFPSTRETRITLVWTDAPGSSNSVFTLVNDLDVSANFKGTTTLGNTQSGVLTAANNYLRSHVGVQTLTNRDKLNTAESIYFAGNTAAEGKKDLIVTVTGVSVPAGPQPYSLVLSGNLAVGSCNDNANPAPPTKLQGF